MWGQFSLLYWLSSAIWRMVQPRDCPVRHAWQMASTFANGHERTLEKGFISPSRRGQSLCDTSQVATRVQVSWPCTLIAWNPLGVLRGEPAVSGWLVDCSHQIIGHEARPQPCLADLSRVQLRLSISTDACTYTWLLISTMANGVPEVAICLHETLTTIAVAKT